MIEARIANVRAIEKAQTDVCKTGVALTMF